MLTIIVVIALLLYRRREFDCQEIIFLYCILSINVVVAETLITIENESIPSNRSTKNALQTPNK